MVQLEEVPDEELNQEQPGPGGKEEDDEWESDSGISPATYTLLQQDAKSPQTLKSQR